IVLGANRRRTQHPGHLSVSANVFSVDCVWSEEDDAATFCLTADACVATGAALRKRTSEDEPLTKEIPAMLPGIETQAEGGFGSSTGIRGEKPLAVPRSQLILEHNLVQHTRIGRAHV